MIKNRKTIALILLITIAIPLTALPITNAQSTKTSYAVIGAMPNPVGVGQEVLIWLGITDQVAHPMPGWKGLTVTVTKPDNTIETLGPFTTDTTGATGTVYVPTMAGTYYLQTHFPEQVLEVASAGIPAGTVYKASESDEFPLIVQETPREYYQSIPLPTEYWSRPVDAQIREWYTIAGNWLGHITATGSAYDLFAPHNIGPETGHILWAKPYAEGGLVGGTLGPHSYDHGDAYEGKWTPPVIINGILYYNQHQSAGGANIEQEVVAQDLRTGEELWRRILGENERLLFGQIYYWDSYNMHGAFAYLWTQVTTGSGAAAVTTWRAYDSFSGRWEFTITNVPSGTTVRGPNGELQRLQVNLQNGWMALWNSSAIISMAGSWRPYGNTYNATATSPASALTAAQRAWSWNVSIPTGLPGGVARILEDRIIGANALPFAGAKVDNFRTWGISLKPEDRGRLLFNTDFPMPQGNLTLSFITASLEDGVFIMATKELRQHYGFSLDTGAKIWGPTPSQPYLDAYNIMAAGWQGEAVAYGKLFRTATSGIVYAYDIKTGQLLWSFDAKDHFTEILWSNNWPLLIAFVTDGKIYLSHNEHSPINPLPRGAPFFALDVETGQEVFSVNLRGHYWGGQPIIGDSIIALFNTYDCRVYSIGKGPSATTVAAPNIGVPLGSSILIQGTVTDISAGTKEYAVSARFPNGVAVVSDESMSPWMEYVYLQMPRPTNATGVSVSIDVVDANGNYRNIGTTVTDSIGVFNFAWTPDISGKYTIIATFAGSKSYYPSYAQTGFIVDETQDTPDPTQQVTQSATDMYLLPGIVAIILAIAIGFAITILILRKRP
jgi:outer membrane protein assembly factor BamB